MVCSRRPRGDCGLLGERWSNPEAQSGTPTTPLLGESHGQSSVNKSTPYQHCQPGGKQRAVSSSLLISVGDLWTCLAFLFLYVTIKYCLSAQLIPKAKGKSVCPHIICKLSPSLRTDLFTGRKSVLYYSAVTPPRLSSLFNVMPAHSYCSVLGLHTLFLGGGTREDRNIFVVIITFSEGKAFILMVEERLGEYNKALKLSNLTLITL